jgi:hypothetical protein
MATTTNYGWTTPDDTALVKDGASAIRTLGSSVDTTTKNLNPETTLGDISFRSSTSNVKTRLGIGGTGTVLTVAGGVPTWAAAGGALTLASIASGNLNSGTSLTISSLTQDFLQLHIFGITCSSNIQLKINLNGDVTGLCDFASGHNTTSTSGNTRSQNQTSFSLNSGSAQDSTNSSNYYILTLQNCKSAGFTTFSWTSGFVNNASENANAFGSGIFKSAAQLTSIKIEGQSAQTFSGSGTYAIYGG